MTKKSKIHQKEFARTLKECVFQLKKIKDENNLISKQELVNDGNSLLSTIESETISLSNCTSINTSNNKKRGNKKTNTTPTDSNSVLTSQSSPLNRNHKNSSNSRITRNNTSSAASSFSSEFDQRNSPSSPIEMKNAWGQKDINSILKEKSKRILFLEGELEERKGQYQRLEQERKKAKIDFEKGQMDIHFEKVIKEKEKELSIVLIENDLIKKKIWENESQLEIEKKANGILEDTNRSLNEITNRKGVHPHKRDYYAFLKKFLENEQEVVKLQHLNGTLERELNTITLSHKNCNETIENLKSLIEDLENRQKFKGFTKEMVLSDIETVLMEEIDNITVAYDKIHRTNLQLEKQLTSCSSQINVISSDSFLIKNKLGHFEETKAYLEKEKKRMEEWKNTLAEETKIFLEKCHEMEHSVAEKDKKICDYKILITNLQSSNKLLENESKSNGFKYRQLKKEYDGLKGEFIYMKTEFETNKKLSDLLKGNMAEAEIVEDLERYKKVIRCRLCDTNLKNCVLIKCSHTFCDSCVNDRLKARQRKCPNCQVEFCSNDIKKLYL